MQLMQIKWKKVNIYTTYTVTRNFFNPSKLNTLQNVWIQLKVSHRMILFYFFKISIVRVCIYHSMYPWEIQVNKNLLTTLKLGPFHHWKQAGTSWNLAREASHKMCNLYWAEVDTNCDTSLAFLWWNV